jgi:hypothetical protein
VKYFLGVTSVQPRVKDKPEKLRSCNQDIKAREKSRSDQQGKHGRSGNQDDIFIHNWRTRMAGVKKKRYLLIFPRYNALSETVVYWDVFGRI